LSATVFFESTNELATLSNTFKVAGVATDPTAVMLTVTSPSGTVSTYTWPTPSTLTHGTAGVFSKDIACSEDGEWQYLWEGTNAASDAEAGTWTVFETSLGHLYCTVAALKDRVRISDTGDDYQLHVACFAASRAIETACERIFYRTATGTVRTFVPNDLWCLKLGPYNDLVSVSTLKTDGSGDGTFETTWLTSDYQLLPVNPGAAPETRPYTKIKAVGGQTFPWICPGVASRDDRVEVTGVFGWPAVPWAVKKAAQMLAEEIFKDAPYGVAGINDFGVIRAKSNPRIQSLIDPYVHPMARLKVA
jgi:hypothetical protein